MNPKYKRILLKVSGEALSGGKGTGLDTDTLASIAAVVKPVSYTHLDVSKRQHNELHNFFFQPLNNPLFQTGNV